MTVIEVLESCVQRIQGARMPVREAESVYLMAGVANDIQACVNTLRAHAEPPAEPEEPEEAEEPEKADEEAGEG